jgi:hypothetical protein
MEIVSYGHIKPREEFCNNCGATLKYVPRDVQTWKPGTHSSKTYIRCPVCGSPIFIDVAFAKNDKYITFAGVDDAEEDATVRVEDLPFMSADTNLLAHNEVHDDDHVAWHSGYLECLRTVQKQVRKAAGINDKKEG